MLCLAFTMRKYWPRLKTKCTTRRGVHYVFNPGHYFRIVNAKHNVIIIIILTVNNLYYYPKPNTTFQWNNKNGPII